MFPKALLPLCALMALASCQNVSIEDIATKMPKGNLTVSISQIEQDPFLPYTRTGLADACSRLNFAVYNLADSRLMLVNQQYGVSAFGSTSFQLDEGKYQLVIVAHSSNGNPTMTNPTKIQFTNAQGFSDTFLCYEDVTMGEEPKTLDLVLSRIVSLCRFTVTDDYPEEAARIRFYYTGGSGAFNARTGLGCVNSKQEKTFDLTSGQKQFDLYTFLHNVESTIHLKMTVYDQGDNVLRERVFDVPMKQKYITWLSYNYSSGDLEKEGITITLNTAWDGEDFDI